MGHVQKIELGPQPEEDVGAADDADDAAADNADQGANAGGTASGEPCRFEIERGILVFIGRLFVGVGDRLLSLFVFGRSLLVPFATTLRFEPDRFVLSCVVFSAAACSVVRTSICSVVRLPITVLRMWPTCIGLATLGEEKSTTYVNGCSTKPTPRR